MKHKIIALDAMGGDHGPSVTVPAAKKALSEIANIQLVLVGDEAQLIAELEKLGMSKESRKKAPTDLKAYDAVLRFYQYETELTPESFEKALASLEQAIEVDPGYGIAYAMIGHLYADNYALGFREFAAPLEKALEFAQKGVALEPQNQFARDAPIRRFRGALKTGPE